MPHIVRGVAVGALLLLVSACGGGDGKPAAKASESASTQPAAAAQVVAPAKVEIIAGMTGCTASIRIQAAELREGSCRTGQGDYIITTFPKESLKDTWLDAAAIYGGTYIVGPQWAVGGKVEVLKKLRPEIGGEIVQLTGSGPSPVPTAP
ncbi:hypothetical protein [Streptomyces acidiscabies]|uniref:Lipoprotein n=1 Tax=Streptomyces acidiscabies TaxID=42234 RepID=A0AAP6EHS2_9ACTN|nr:hypothetical protein [Streptomyces acidiscabies]MBZ3917593.1 hypothetical protein [Streptomyces acidiscabies]MDX2962720.1 hypothetical protein [Streptomyces acidiscabies]MDX3018973.1 hypothetical protein [Streptomyces acidiscabies]MDX3790355.1 hypothetical protein [Streptomyces acidiscabies]GAV45869.1 hypothetical protein Saa2_08868 [Streptomyces acidiscabies]